MYSIYIFKQVHPNIGISSKAMSILSKPIKCIVTEASHLAHYNKKNTITNHEIQTAVRLHLPELSSMQSMKEPKWPNTPAAVKDVHSLPLKEK